MLNFGGVSNQGKQASEQVFCQRFSFVSAEACNNPQCPETLEKGHGPLSLCHSTQACGFLPAGSSHVIEVEAFKTNSEKFLLSSMSLLHKIQTHAKTGPMPQAERSWMWVECIDSSERSTLWERMACDFFQSSLTDFAIVANTCLQTAATHFSEPPAESFLHRAAPVTPPAFENGTGASKWEPTPFGAPLSGFDVG